VDVDVDVYDKKLQNLVVHTNWDNQCSFKPIFVSSLQMILQYVSPECHCTCITMEVTCYPSISHMHIFFFLIYWHRLHSIIQTHSIVIWD